MPISMSRSGLVICGFMGIFDLALGMHLLISLQSIALEFTQRQLVNKKAGAVSPALSVA